MAGLYHELAILDCQLGTSNSATNEQEQLPMSLRNPKDGELPSHRRRGLQGKDPLGGHSAHGQGPVRITRTAAAFSDIEGGCLLVRVGKDEFLPFSESSPAKVLPMFSPGPFPLQLAFCGSPVHGTVEPRSLTEWLQFHLFSLGMDRVLMFDAGGIIHTVRGHLQPFIAAGVLSIVEFKSQEQYPSWYFGQAVAMHDCLFSLRNQAKWVAFGDFDEYLQSHIPPPISFQFYLNRYARTRAWVSYGGFLFAQYCQGKPTPWLGNVSKDGGERLFAVELMRWRHADPFCQRSLRNPDPPICLGVAGRRKFTVNPRQVELLAIHRVQEVAEEVRHARPLHIRTVQISFAHFKGLTQQGFHCLPARPENNSDVPLIHEPNVFVPDDSIAKLAKMARKCSEMVEVPSFECKERS